MPKCHRTKKAVVNVPGQRGGNITLCAAICLQGVLHHHATLGLYNTAHIIIFLDALHNAVVQSGPEQHRFVVIWDNVSFHRAALVRDWITNHNNFSVVYLPPYSRFLNPIEELFSACRWKVYDCQPHARLPLLKAMEEACGDIEVGSEGDIFPVAYPGMTLLVMWMRWCGQTLTEGGIHKPSIPSPLTIPHNTSFCLPLHCNFSVIFLVSETLL